MDFYDIITGVRALLFLGVFITWLPVGFDLRMQAKGEHAWLQRRIGFSFIMVGASAVAALMPLALYAWGLIPGAWAQAALTIQAMLLLAGGIDIAVFWYKANGHRHKA